MVKRYHLIFAALVLLALVGVAQPVVAADPDLPLAAASPLTGVGFDDKPLFLPVQKNFQMAMLTAGSELGRSCGKMEAYGWRMGQGEQARVNQIFNSTVDRFRGLGYEVAMQSPNSVSRDITLFTADRSDKHFMSMWSAGEIGLVMVLCETSGSRHGRATASRQNVPQLGNSFSLDKTPSAPAASDVPAPYTPSNFTMPKTDYASFSPVGSWVGSYICAQGYTGGTLSITQLHGDNFEGVFHFYPTEKNRTVPEGRYTVYGQYDRASQRILINPGKWLQRPANFYNTIIIGSFDPANDGFSAYFQGINGCTSFEAHRDNRATHEFKPTAHHKHVKKKAPKKTAAKLSAKDSLSKMIEAPVLASPATAADFPVPPAPSQVTAPAAAPAPAQTTEAPAAAPAAAAPPPAAAATVTAPAADTATQEKLPLVVGAPTSGIAVPAPAPAAK